MEAAFYDNAENQGNQNQGNQNQGNQMIQKTLLGLLAGILLLLSGCPDYSHLNDVPDYSTMTDGGGQIENE